MLELFHFLHVAAGATAIGGEIMLGWVIFPALLKLSPEARRDQFVIMTKMTSPIMGAALLLILVAGIGRVWVSGYVTSPSDLTHGYGLLVSLALVALIVWAGLEIVLRERLLKAADALDTAAYETGYRRVRLVSATAMLIILALMVSMRLGLY